MLTYYAFVSTFPLLLVLVTVTEIVLGNHPELCASSCSTRRSSEFPVAGPDAAGLGADAVGLGAGARRRAGRSRSGAAAVSPGRCRPSSNSLWLVPKRHWPGFPWNYLRSIALLLLLGVGVVLTALMAAFAGAGHVLGLSGGPAYTC